MTTLEEHEEKLRQSGLVIFQDDHRFAEVGVVAGGRTGGIQYACLRCGCMMVRFNNGEIMYKARKLLAVPRSRPPKCFLHPKSEYEKQIKALIEREGDPDARPC